MREAFWADLKADDVAEIEYEWSFWARDSQLVPPGEWRTWLILAGRGFGKTRTGAETVRDWAESGTYGRLHLVGPTASDVRDVMIDGQFVVRKGSLVVDDEHRVVSNGGDAVTKIWEQLRAEGWFDQ